MSAITLEKIQVLINQRKWRRALWQARHPETQARYERTAHYWLTLALCQLLVGQWLPAEHSFDQAKMCDDFTPELEGDFSRDRALYWIRRKRLEHAAYLLKKCSASHQTTDRAALLESCWGRLEAARGNWAKAIAHYQKALEMWRSIHDPNIQWIMNNRFHWMKALAARGEDTTWIVNTILGTDPSSTRRRRAEFIGRFGQLANRIDDLLVALLHL